MTSFKPAYEGCDLPPRVLDLFAASADGLRWSATPPASWRGAVRAPWGRVAGGKPVLGRGRLINAKRMNLLSADVLFALDHGGEWSWQISASLVPTELLGTDTMHLEQWRTLIRARFYLNNGALCWLVDRGFNADRSVRYPAGSRVTGLAMSGFRAPLVATGGMSFLSTDVISVLEHDRFPFEAQWD